MLDCFQILKMICQILVMLVNLFQWTYKHSARFTDQFGVFLLLHRVCLRILPCPASTERIAALLPVVPPVTTPTLP